MIAFAPRPGDADFTADHIGIIGDSADKRFTFVRNDYKSGDPSPPEYILIIDWKCGDYWWKTTLPTWEPNAAERVAKARKAQGPSPGLGFI